MSPMMLERLLESLRAIAHRAGEAILAVSAHDAEPTLKGDGSPVTQADRASHDVIESQLLGLEVDLPIISEEGDLGRIPEGSSAEAYWLVDPLDGTKEFVKGLDEYTVNIALIERGVPTLGVILVPARGTLYYAATGLGAWKVQDGADPQRISASGSGCVESAATSRSHLAPQTQRFLEAMNVKEIVRIGSSLKMCLVAEGAVDIYPRFSPTYFWDTAAGTAIASEAQCLVLDLEGKKLSYKLGGDLRHDGFIVQGASVGILTTGVTASGHEEAQK